MQGSVSFGILVDPKIPVRHVHEVVLFVNEDSVVRAISRHAIGSIVIEIVGVRPRRAVGADELLVYRGYPRNLLAGQGLPRKLLDVLNNNGECWFALEIDARDSRIALVVHAMNALFGGRVGMIFRGVARIMLDERVECEVLPIECESWQPMEVHSAVVVEEDVFPNSPRVATRDKLATVRDAKLFPETARYPGCPRRAKP